jgi:hypothetical protein
MITMDSMVILSRQPTDRLGEVTQPFSTGMMPP